MVSRAKNYHAGLLYYELPTYSVSTVKCMNISDIERFCTYCRTVSLCLELHTGALTLPYYDYILGIRSV